MSATRCVCPSCDATLKLNATATAGKKVKCPRCATVFPVPAAREPKVAVATAARQRPRPAGNGHAEEGRRPRHAEKSARAGVPLRKRRPPEDEFLDEEGRDDEDFDDRPRRRGKGKDRQPRPSLALRVSALVLAVIGGLFSGGLGAVWLAQASSPEVKAMRELAGAIADQAGAQELKADLARFDRLVQSSYFLLLAAPLGIAGGVLAVLGRGKLGGALMLAAVPVPVLLNVVTLMPLFFLLVGGLVALLTPSWAPGGGPSTAVVALLTAGGWVAVLVGWVVLILALPKPTPEVKAPRERTFVPPARQGGPVGWPGGGPPAETPPRPAGPGAQPTDGRPVAKVNSLEELLKEAPAVPLVKHTFKLDKTEYTIDAPAGVQFTQELGDMHMTYAGRAGIEIERGSRDMAKEKQWWAGIGIFRARGHLFESADTLFTEADQPGEDRFHFDTNVTTGHRDVRMRYTKPGAMGAVLGGKGDCLLLLKCARTVAVKTPPPADPAAALEAMGASLSKDDGGKVTRVGLGGADPTRSTLVLLKKLPDLRELDCTFIKAEGADFAPLKDLPNLESLRLHSSFIGDAGLPYLSGLTRLKDLNLEWSQVTAAGLGHLKPLTQLTSLTLDRNDLGGPGFAAVSALTRLERLSASNTKLTDESLKSLAGLTALRSLNLDYCGAVSDAGVAHLQGLTGLEDLNLGHTKVTDAGLARLKGLKKLKRLSVSGAPVTAAGVAEIQKAIPGLKVDGPR